MLSWWRHAAPAGAQIRAILVLEGDGLVGIAPFFALRRRGLVEYALLGAPAAGGVEPLARAQTEAECARLFSDGLASATPRPSMVRLRQIRRGSPWPRLLQAAWPGARPVLLREHSIAAPYIERGGETFEGYFAKRSANFRAECRRHRRQLERHGLVQRVAGHGPEIERDLRRFAALHYQRWEQRGGTAALRPEIERLLQAAAGELAESERLRVFSLDVGGETASVQIFFAAGGEVAYWLGGFDERWGSFGPGNLGVLAAVEDFFRRGEKCLDLGPGGQRYKYRFATGERVFDTMLLAPRGVRLARIFAFHLARLAKRSASSRVLPRARAVRGRASERLARGRNDSAEVARSELLVHR
jgi:CelD/BcsL family acetyltransferase involved in cellulose biosynthesis